MAGATDTVHDGTEGSDLFGQPEGTLDGQPAGETEEGGELDPGADAETAKVQEYIDKYKLDDGGIDVEKLAKEAMNAQKLIGRRGQEVGQYKKQAEEYNNLLSYVNADPKRVAAFNKLVSGDMGGDVNAAAISSADIDDQKLIELMRAGKIVGPMKSVAEAYLKELKIVDEVRTVKQSLEQLKAEQARASREAQACKFLAALESEGWTKEVGGGHYFFDSELDAKFVELFNQGHTPKHAFAIAKEELGITETPKKPSAKKKAAMMGAGGSAKTIHADNDDVGGDEFAALKSAFENAYGSDITKPRT